MLEHIVLDPPPAGIKDLSGIKTTVITVGKFSSGIEGESSISARTGGIMSADMFVSSHHFEDAMMVTSFGDLEVNFDQEVE